MTSSVVVVGAGVLGSSLADRLARSGWGVTHVEQLSPGHVRSGSGDESRLIRASHGDDELHARMSRRALELWRELDPRLVSEAGVAWFARRADGWEAASERVLTRLGIPNERVDPAALFPSVNAGDLAFTLLEPEAGLLRAREGVRALADRAVAAGAQRVTAVARPDGERVVLDDGRILEADHVVWACGAWMAALFGDVIDLRITHQDVFYFGADERFVVSPHPAHGGRVWLVGGGSGHAFKHGPALAERLETWIAGIEEPEACFTLGEHRRHDVQLRTGGTTL